MPSFKCGASAKTAEFGYCFQLCKLIHDCLHLKHLWVRCPFRPDTVLVRLLCPFFCTFSVAEVVLNLASIPTHLTFRRIGLTELRVNRLQHTVDVSQGFLQLARFVLDLNGPEQFF